MAQVAQRVDGAAGDTAATTAQGSGAVDAATTSGPVAWLVAGAVAGGVAGVLFSVVVPPQDMMPMVAALYGLDGVVWGWVFHLLHSLAFGAAFALLVRPLRGAASRWGGTASWAVLGAAYGAVVWVIFASFVMPAWIGAVTDMAPPVPDWNRLSLVAHVVYGVALAALLPALAAADQRGTGDR